jgi:hypothetical protein
VFKYLAEGTDATTSILKPIVSALSKIAATTGIEILDVSAEGGKGVINASANIVDVSLTKIQKTTPGGLNGSGTETEHTNEGENVVPNPPVGTPNVAQTSNSFSRVANPNSNIAMYQNINSVSDASAVNAALNSAQSTMTTNYKSSELPINSGKGHQDGWCYIGTDRGVRTCSQVGVKDTCMSGDIFPSQDICVNPSLR